MAAASAGLTAAEEARLAENGAKAAVRKERAPKAKADKPARETTPGQRSPRDCECGCGAQTKGGRFLPGHDAKLHSRQKAEAKAKAEAEAAQAPGQTTVDEAIE